MGALTEGIQPIPSREPLKAVAEHESVMGRHPEGVAVGDLNGDGDLDLAAANINSNNVSTLFGAGDGTFGTATNYPADGSPKTVSMGDLNRDGELDLAVADNSSSDVSVLLQDSTSPNTKITG